jgi:drug/metabolite transporter (DMT)-like permease
MSQHTPTRTLWAGIIIAAAGVLMLALSGDLLPNLAFFTEPSGQALLGPISLLDSAIRFLALPLGCALIAAGLIMRYMRYLHEHPFTHLDPDSASQQQHDGSSH